MKNFYEVVKDGAMVSYNDEFQALEDVYSEFCNDCYEDTECELEYQGSPLVLKGILQEGGEGEGNLWRIIFSVTYMGETTNYGLNGWYASYAGHEFHSYKPHEVEYKEVCRMEWVVKS